MPVETALWRVNKDGLRQARRSALKREADLQKWIEADPKLIGRDLMIVGSEVVTVGGRIDLLALDPVGTVHVIELKRDKTPREVVAQALDYASWVSARNADDFHEIYRRYKSDDLGRAYRDRFGVPLPETLAEEHRITIVASSLDSSSERIVSYLSEYHGVPINAVFFSVFDDGTGEVLTRSWLLNPEEVEIRAEDRSAVRRERGDWTGFWFVNVGVTADEDRSWDDARTYGFLSGGQGARYGAAMRKLSPGDKVFAYVIKRGYVGFGIVEREATMARDFRLRDGRMLFDVELKGTTIRENPDDEERAEYVVGVSWEKTFPLEEAQKYNGIFSNQNIVCKIWDAATAEFLIERFGAETEPAE